MHGLLIELLSSYKERMIIKNRAIPKCYMQSVKENKKDLYFSSKLNSRETRKTSTSDTTKNSNK